MQVQIDLTQIILAALGIFGAIITSFVIPLLKAKLGGEKWDQLVKVVDVVCNAAEQLGIVGKLEDKFDWAMEQVKAALAAKNIKMDDATIKAAIEAWVRQFNNQPIAELTVDDLIKLKEAGLVNANGNVSAELDG